MTRPGLIKLYIYYLRLCYICKATVLSLLMMSCCSLVLLNDVWCLVLSLSFHSAFIPWETGRKTTMLVWLTSFLDVLQLASAKIILLSKGWQAGGSSAAVSRIDKQTWANGAGEGKWRCVGFEGLLRSLWPRGKSWCHVSYKFSEIESANNVTWVAEFPGYRVPSTVIFVNVYITL